MPKKLLIETRMNSLSLCEGVQPKTKGCLGTISGPCADFKNATRNENFYSRKLWENVFKDPLVVESLEDKVLIGELDHPGDRLETKATNACIVMTGYDFNDKEGVVEGTFDILDTPNGRILRSLLDYGCKIGVSSRGEGDVTEENGMNKVDEESYYFVAFDAVVLPAVKKAKPALQESLKIKGLRESLGEQVSSASTKEELDLIKKVVEATELPEVDSLLESIQNKSKELEGSNSSSNLKEDLEKATKKIQELTEDNKNLNKEVVNYKSKYTKIFESRQKLLDKSNSSSKEVSSLNEKYNDTVFKYGETKKKLEGLSKEVSRAKGISERLNEEIEKLKFENSHLKTKVSELEDSLSSSQKLCNERGKKVKELSESLDSYKESYESKIKSYKEESKRKIEESKKSESSLKSSRDKYKSLVEQMVREKAKSSGINPDKIVESLSPKTTASDISKMIEEEVNRSDRYRKMPIVNDRLIESVSKGTVKFKTDKISQEDSQTISFMNQFYHQES